MPVNRALVRGNIVNECLVSSCNALDEVPQQQMDIMDITMCQKGY